MAATAKNAVFTVAMAAGCVWAASDSLAPASLVAELLVFAVPLDGELHEAVEELRVGDP